MIENIRHQFNQQFNENKYLGYLEDINEQYHKNVEFRLAETPVFIPRHFKDQMIDTCEAIIDRIIQEDFLSLTNQAIPEVDFTEGSENNCQMMAFDFGICENEYKQWNPQLIEMQGFPSLYGFQVMMADMMKNHYEIPDTMTPYLGNYNAETYWSDLKEIIVGSHQPDEVVLLEIQPEKQKTWIDFYATKYMTGIQILCITALIAEGDELFYINPDTNKKTQIKRIYNRVIFDELHARQSSLGNIVDIRKKWKVEWVTHPNWFYRISKYTLPLLNHPHIPSTYYLDQLETIPEDLENYVLKPLFSFAGKGVLIDVTITDIQQLPDPQNWILQKKVHYASAIKTPNSPAKAEIRIMYLWKQGWSRPKPAINLARLSKGKMIGVDYNKNKDWVGGSICFFEN